METNSEITYEQFLELKKKFDDAENDTTPYAIIDDTDGDKLKVIGDVNNTEPKKFDYAIDFYYQNTLKNFEALKGEEIIGQTPNYIGVRRRYTDAWIPPRRFTEVQATLVQLYKFFNLVTEAGELRDLTHDEMLVALKTMNNEMVDAMCDVVCTVLRIPFEWADYIMVTSAVNAIAQMAEDFPEVINGMDFTTGKLSDKN